MRRIVVSSIIALIVIGLLTAGYFFYRRYSVDVAEAIRAVPPDAAFVIECRNAQTTLFNLRQTDYWQNFSGNPSMKQFEQNLLHLDSVFSADADFSVIWKNKPVVISAHITKAEDFDWLFLLEMPRGTNGGDAKKFITKILSASQQTGDSSSAGSSLQVTNYEYEGVFINEFNMPAGKTFSFAMSKGILMCSYTSFLVEDAIRQLKNGSSLKSDKSFSSIYKIAAKNTDAGFYFNYNSFSHFLGIFSNKDAASTISLSAALAEWSGTDVVFHSSAIVLNGYSSANDSSQLMTVMRNQQPQAMRMADILPARTSFLFHIGMSDSKKFFEQLEFSSYGSGETKEHGKKNAKLSKTDLKHAASGIKSSAQFSLKNKFTSWVGHEMALAITESNSANYRNNSFACIEARDIHKAMQSLKEVCSATEPIKGMPCKMEIYRGHEIGLIKTEGLLKTVYGKLFEGIQKNYFTSAGNYIVFANQASSLRGFIDDAEDGKTLSSDSAYRQVLANSEPASNVFVYLNCPRSLNIIKSLSSDTIFRSLEDQNAGINAAWSGLSAITLQYTNKNNLISNHFILQFNEEAKKSVSMVWSASCDTSIHSKPQAVTDGTDTYIMIQDDANSLYLFDNGGQSLWKKQMTEKIMSDIYSIDFFHNGTQQFLFNTASSLYLIDKSGAYIGNFPIRLPAQASNGCAIADFDNNHDYKIFVACTNQMLYAYEMNGRAMEGWLCNNQVGKISLPVKYFKVKDKDYLFVATADGRMEFLDRRGALRTKVAEKIMISPCSDVVALDTGNALSAHVALADTSGNIFAVYTDGHVNKAFSNHFTQPVFFDVTDINNDDKEDYILFGNNIVSAQDADSSVLFTHEFRNAPLGLSIAVSGGLVGSISSSTNELTIFNADGTTYPGFPVKGNTAFTVTTINKDSKKYIAVGSSDGNLYFYVVE